MGAIRNALKVVSSLLFSTLLFITIMTFGLARLTQYENLKPIITDIISKTISKQINGAQLSQIYPYIELYCKYKNETIKLNFTIEEVEISCQEVLNKTTNQIIEILASKAFNKIYYRKYDCEIIDCLRQAKDKMDYLVLMSEKFNIFLKGIFPYLFLATISFLIIFLIVSENWYLRIKNLGVTFLMFGLPYFFFKFTSNELLQNFLPPDTMETLTPVINAILSYFNYAFLLTLIFGGILLIVALFIKLMRK